MTINQEPTNVSTYFSKAVPDIILTKSGTETSVLLELKKGTEVILTVKYMFDANNSIRFREIGEIFEQYRISKSHLSLKTTKVLTSTISKSP